MNPTLICFAALMALVGAAEPDAKCQMNGKSFDKGAMFDGTDAFYFCKSDGSGGAKAEAIGCISDGKRVYDLALFQKGDNVFRCRAQETTVTADLWGCVVKKADGTTEQKSIACTWDVGTDPINYVNCCINKGGSAVVTQLYCLYTYRGGRIQINDGCYRIFPDVGLAAGCKRVGDSLSLTTWSSKNAASDPQASGMTECPIDS